MIAYLIHLINWWRDLKSGYYVASYEHGNGWVRADCIFSDRYIVSNSENSWVLKCTASCGYDACKQGDKWFTEMKTK